MHSIPMEQRVKIRSTGRLSAKKMLPLREMLESSQTLYDYDRQRARPYGELKFSAVDMMIICLFMEIKKLTFEGLTEALDGRGGQVVLKNLGMPKGKNGRFQRPSNAWISTFRNHDYMYFRHELDRELRDTVLPKGRKNHVLLTCDSTPAEASRYSKWAQYNVHYEVRMCKVHIIMADGVPLVWDVTNGNASDNPEFRKLLKRLDGARMTDSYMLTDGGYDSFESYADVYSSTGLVMSSNNGVNAVFHEEATWNKLLRLYNGMSKETDFKPSKYVSKDYILKFLMRHGHRERVGWFLRNLDMRRGKEIHREHARRRHVCETVHRAMKRWLNFDVRGLWRKYAGRRLMLKMVFCTMLCMFFQPYDI